MKKWLQNLSGAVMASLLAITLNGKAYAEDRQTVPAEAPTEVVETVPEPVAVSEPESEPAPAAIAPEASVAETAPVSAAAPASVEVAPAPAMQTEVSTPAPTALSEDLSATPNAAEAAAKATALVEAPFAFETPAITETPVEKAPTSIPEAPVAAEVTPIVEEQPAVKPAVDEIPVEIKTAEEEVEEPGVKESTNKSADESILEDEEESVQKFTAKDVSSDIAAKVTASETISMTRDGLPSDGKTEKDANLLFVQENPEKTALLEEKNEIQWEEQPKDQLEEQVEESAKRGSKAEESIKEESKTPAMRGSEGENTNTQSDPVSVFSNNGNGSYTLVNHIGGESISAEGDVTVFSAGMNHISSISGTGTVSIAGTGILLLDSIEGNVHMLTFTDIYEQGSVALFVKESDGRYVLRNGTVPGILDEEYTIPENVTLVMPDQTSLLLCGTGAEPILDENGVITSVNYYHGTEHDYFQKLVDYHNVVEQVGKLTIAKQAALIVQRGASIFMENLKSLSFTDLIFDIRYPELNVMDGGKLTIDGSVGDGGSITIDGESGMLSGSGSMSASRITMDATVLNSTDVSLNNTELHIRNTEPIQNLKITDCTLMPERIQKKDENGNIVVEDDQKHIQIIGLETAGSCSVDLPAGSRLELSTVNGTLTLKTRYEPNYQVYFDPIINDDNAIISISGNVGGIGSICFESGYFALEQGMELKDVQVQLTKGGYHVYDYTGELTTFMFPLLCVQPAQMKSADANNGTIPVAVAMYSFDEKTKIITLEEQHGPSEELDYPMLSVSPSDNGSRGMTGAQMVSYLQEYIDKAKQYDATSASVEFLHINSDGRLSINEYTYNNYEKEDSEVKYELTLKGSDELIGSDEFIPMGDVCLLRIKINPQMHMEAPVTASTQTGTSFTGSGILGGSGAGPVNIGQGTAGSNTNTNTTNNTNGNTSGNTSTQKLTTLMAYVDEAQEQTALVWVEVAPEVDQEATSPKETVYVLLTLEGEKTLKEMGGRATVSMSYVPPAEYEGKPLYVVFRNRDNSLTAIRATYSTITKHLAFIADRLGTFMIVGLDFDVTDIPEGEDFPPEFYEALAKLPELKNLTFTEVGVI